jgi:tetratricopeptide (TPR) repeat protein
MSSIKFLLLSSVLSLFISISHGQDSSLNYAEETIASYQLDSLNYDFIQNLSVIDSTINATDIQNFKSILDRVIHELPEREKSKKKEEKRIKRIFDKVHEELFKKYEDLAYFPQIFSEGIYNCVTATAIYAHIFDAISVPYYIKDEPTHVYLIAYPETYKIHLETTVPSEYGFSSVSDSNMETIVNELVKMKLITADEVSEKGISKVYMEYFYGDEFVDKKALIGMQYYNKAIEYYEAQNYELALHNIENSLVYYPYAASEYMKKSLSILTLNSLEFDTIGAVKQFFDVFSDLNFDEDYNIQDLNYYLFKIVNHDNNTVEFVERASKICLTVQDEKMKEHCLTFLYDEILDHYLKAEDYDKGIYYSKKLMEINPNSKRAKEGITYALSKKLALLPMSESSISTIDKAVEDFPFLQDNIRIKSFKAFVLIQLIEQSYTETKTHLGEEYLSQLESIVDSTEKTLLVNSEMIAYAYFCAGKYYYRHNKFVKAKKYLSQGLEHAPDNRDLKKHLNWTLEEMR